MTFGEHFRAADKCISKTGLPNGCKSPKTDTGDAVFTAYAGRDGLADGLGFDVRAKRA